MNCKPGDLAVLMGLSGEWSANNGHIVEVLHLAYGDTWSVKCIAHVKGFMASLGIFLPAVPGEVCECRDKWLRPISGVPVNDEVKDEVGA
ncbi:hypothetical protein [Paraburkholderia fungorum]|uniref:hypothetical protein n=1 Tax=Paraburkholderia fungorum TaxID=134537 RepID=UPI00161A2332|nr:hypothetical protein [Paraburkholderia fungorum]MBB5547514.1 hypothetical protein [Paraburkholderia fungorum]